MAVTLPPGRGADAGAKTNLIAYVGTYTGDQSRGIYAFRFDTAAQRAAPLGCVAETENPSFLALHPSGRYLYAVNEVGTFDGEPAGAVSAFAVDPASGRLKLLNQVSSRGTAPCHLVLDAAGRHVLVANYGGGSVLVRRLLAGGGLGDVTAFAQHRGASVHPQRQTGPHAHGVAFSPDNRFALVADLGLDQVLVYRFDAASGKLEPHDPSFAALKPGSGPRHLAFARDGRRVYVLNELASTLTAFDYEPASGRLNETQTVSTLPADFAGANTTAEVAVHPSGRFVYGSNRGHDSVAVFATDAADGGLRPIEVVSTKGRTPRNFALDPSGAFLWAANQGSNAIALFRIDHATGRLQPQGEPFTVGSPVCVVFLPVP